MALHSSFIRRLLPGRLPGHDAWPFLLAGLGRRECMVQEFSLMEPSLEQFAESVVASGLLSAEELAQFQQRLAAEHRPSSAEQLGKLLIQHGLLTPFQASCLWRGRTKGLVLGEYVVLDKLGQGGMGMVLKARHRRMDRVVALKTLPAQSMRKPEAVQRFYREVKAAARLLHPNIVTAYDAGEQEGIHYLVMEYVEGQDLASLLKERGPLPVPQALDCMIQAARGLAYAHSQGVIHRDIKLGNLLMDRQGVVKILDMGLARLALGTDKDDASEEQLTVSGQVMGTCDYMAPEQAVSTHRVDHRADIYSLGCTLYRLLTGEPPYSGQTLMEVLLAHREAPIPSLRAKRPDVSEELEAVFRRMVAKQPEERYGTMAEVAAALEGCLAACTAGVGGGQDASLWDAEELPIGAWLERVSPPPASGGLPESSEHTVVHGADPATPTFHRPPAETQHPQLLVPPSPHPQHPMHPSPQPPHSRPSAPARLLQPVVALLRERPTWAAALAGALLGIVVGVFVLMGRSSSPPPTAERPESSKKAPALATKPSSKDSPKTPPAKPDWKPRWESVDREAKGLANQQEFGKAIALYQPLLEQFQDLELLGEVKEAIAKLEAQASTAANQAQAQARRLMEQKQFAEARQTLQPVVERFAIAEHAESARKLLAEIDQAENAEKAAMAAKAAPPPPPPKTTAPSEQLAAEAELKRLQEEQTRWHEATAAVEERVAAWDFRGALAALDHVPAELPGWKERLSARRKEIVRMGRLKVRIVAAINQADPPLEKRALLLKGINARIAGADEEGISAQLPNGKTERHAWGQLSEKSQEKVLLLAVDPQQAEDWIAAGLVALGTQSPGLAERCFDRAKDLGADVAPYLVPLAEGAFARAQALLRQAEAELAAARQPEELAKRSHTSGRFAAAEKKLQEVTAELDALESRYASTPWFASHKQAVAAARQGAGRLLAESTAERLYAEAAQLFEQKELHDLKPLVEELKGKYANTLPVTDAGRQPPFAELEKATANLGKRIVVRQDGKGDFTSIQAAIDAAPANSLIEIQDSGTYVEKLEVVKDGLTIRGRRGCWPHITLPMAAAQTDVYVVGLSAPRTTLERLAIVRPNPNRRSLNCIGAFAGTLRIRYSIIYMDASPEGFLIRKDAQCVIDNCVVLAILVSQGQLAANNSIFLGFSGGPSAVNVHYPRAGLRSCTIIGICELWESPNDLLNCIIGQISRGSPEDTLEHCDLFGNPPFYASDARAGRTCFSADPMFRDPANLDFRLRPGSPCIGKASDGGDIGCRYTPEMLEMINVAMELRRRGVIKF